MSVTAEGGWALLPQGLTDAPEIDRQAEVDRLIDRLGEPQTAAALHILLDNIELLAVIVSGLDGLARKGEVIGDTLAEVLEELRAAGRSTGLDPVVTSRQLATLIPTLADASPVINRVMDSPIVAPEPIGILSDTAVALVRGLERAQESRREIGVTGLVRATRDQDVRRGLGFFVEVLRELGSEIAEPNTSPTEGEGT